MTCQVTITPAALQMLQKITDRRVRAKLRDRIDELEHDPELQGKALMGELAGYRSVRAIGQRYRVLYRVDRKEVTVYVVALGIRKEGSREDVYQLAGKLLRLLQPWKKK
ncbi:MAG: type II toxin-antitoxin system mRNA interferase toxin, RelE/StbE family [Acidobacteria bacterium]|nr:type II toxin-antitoxin system mRNA interferase toxin, RelE/StbE family [Acidobacteriota bacterium]